MSHITLIKTGIKDLDCLEEACRALNKSRIGASSVTLVRDQKEFDSYRSNNRCSHVLKVSTSDREVEIGLRKNKHSQSFNLVYDDIGAIVLHTLGSDAEMLIQAYGEAVTLKESAIDGFVMSDRSIDEDGNVVLDFYR